MIRLQLQWESFQHDRVSDLKKKSSYLVADEKPFSSVLRNPLLASCSIYFCLEQVEETWFALLLPFVEKTIHH